DCAQFDVADAKHVAVAYGAVRERRIRFCAEHDIRATALSQLPMSADEVGVKVRLEDVANGHAKRLRSVEILIDIALRIDDDSLTAIRDQVRRVRQASEVELVEVHCAAAGFRGLVVASNRDHYLHVISYVQFESPRVWHLVSTTLGSVPPWRRIDSR